MFRVSLRNLTGRFWTLVLTALAVVAGTAFVAGALIFTDSISDTFDRAFGAAEGSTDVVVRGTEGAGSSGFGDGRTPLPLTLADELADVDGVEGVVPQIQGSALIVGADGTAVRNGNAPGFAFAFDPGDTSSEIVEGRAPENGSEIAVEQATLEKSGLSVGDETKLVALGEPSTVTIVGEVESATSFGATLLYLDQSTAESIFASDGTVSAFSLRAADGVGQEELADAVRDVIPDTAEAVTEDEVTAEAKDAVSTALGFVSTFLVAVGVVALLVGMLIIFNVFSMLVARRTRELALLRAVGASRGQVLRTVITEGVAVGVLGSAVGVGVGVLIALGLQAFVATFGFQIDRGAPLGLRTVLVTLIAGTLATLVASLVPAIRAAGIPPVAALRDTVALPERRVRLWVVIGLVLAALGTALLLVGLFADVPQATIVVGVGALVTFIGALIAGPGLARPFVWLVTVPSIALWGTVGVMARRNALRNPLRTALTAGALMIGTALVGAATIVASSVSASVADTVRDDLKADYVLTSGQTGVFPTTVTDQVAEVDGVAEVVPTRFVQMVAAPDGVDAAQLVESVTSGADSGPQPISLPAIAGGLPLVMQAIDLAVVSGDPDATEDDSLAVSDTLAEANDWSVGDTVTVLPGAAQPRDLTVTAVYEDSPALNGIGAIVSERTWEDATPAGQRVDQQVFVLAADGTDLDGLKQDLTDVVKPYLVISVLDTDGYVSTATSFIQQLLGVIAALVGLSILVAAIGIVITLVLSVVERQRELGLLRAVGVSRRQLRRIVTLEGVATSVFGALLGIGLGVVFGLSLQRALADSGLDTLSIPWLTLVGMVVAGALVGVVAAAAPAWWASRQDVLRAIATE